MQSCNAAQCFGRGCVQQCVQGWAAAAPATQPYSQAVQHRGLSAQRSGAVLNALSWDETRHEALKARASEVDRLQRYLGGTFSQHYVGGANPYPIRFKHAPAVLSAVCLCADPVPLTANRQAERRGQVGAEELRPSRPSVWQQVIRAMQVLPLRQSGLLAPTPGSCWPRRRALQRRWRAQAQPEAGEQAKAGEQPQLRQAVLAGLGGLAVLAAAGLGPAAPAEAAKAPPPDPYKELVELAGAPDTKKLLQAYEATKAAAAPAGKGAAAASKGRRGPAAASAAARAAQAPPLGGSGAAARTPAAAGGAAGTV